MPTETANSTSSHPSTPDFSTPTTDTPTTDTPTSPDTEITAANPQTSPKPAPDITPAPMTSTIMNAPLYKPKNKLVPVTIILAIIALAGIIASAVTLIKSSNQESEIITLKNELDRYQAIYEAENPSE